MEIIFSPATRFWGFLKTFAFFHQCLDWNKILDHTMIQRQPNLAKMLNTKVDEWTRMGSLSFPFAVPIVLFPRKNTFLLFISRFYFFFTTATPATHHQRPDPFPHTLGFSIQFSAPWGSLKESKTLNWKSSGHKKTKPPIPT
jgi:hypothetical protein